jgi:hypothetical protein
MSRSKTDLIEYYTNRSKELKIKCELRKKENNKYEGERL